MPDVTILRPGFDLATAVHLAQTHYNLTVTARELPSERDQNFLLTATDGSQYVREIAGRTESRATVELESAIMAHRTRHGARTNYTTGVILTKKQPSTYWGTANYTPYPARLIRNS